MISPKTSTTRAKKILNAIRVWNDGLSLELRLAKYDKMATSLYTFYQGTNHLFWADFENDSRLKHFSNDKTRTWLDGDVEVHSFGSFYNLEGDVIYGVNDFDESIIANYQYDVWRLAISLVLIARQNGNLAQTGQENVINAFATSYLNTLETYRNMKYPTKAIFTKHNTYGKLDNFLKGLEIHKSRTEMLKEWIGKGEIVLGFKLTNDKLSKVTGKEREAILAGIPGYIETLKTELVYDDEHFKVKDIARRLADGVSDMGVSRYYVLIEGENPAWRNDIILDVKRQTKPCAYLYLSEAERTDYDRTFENEAQRHAIACRAIIPQTDNYLGWMKLPDGYYSVRERSPYKGAFPAFLEVAEEYPVDLKLIHETQYIKMAEQWAMILATNHARAELTDEELLRPYAFEKEVGELTYNHQTDFQALVRDVAFGYAEQVQADWKHFTQSLS